MDAGEHGEIAQSVVSYTGGGGLISASVYADFSNGLHIVALGLGVVLVGIRVVYDWKKLRNLK